MTGRMCLVKVLVDLRETVANLRVVGHPRSMHPRTLAFFALTTLLASCGDPDRVGGVDDGGGVDATADTGADSTSDTKADAPDAAPDSAADVKDSAVDSAIDTSPVDTGPVDTGPVDTGVKPLSCVGATTETFNAKMIGCAAANVFADRAKVCPSGTHVCTAKEWMDNRGSLAPKHHYWTNDLLKYNGTGASACSVSLTAGSDCGATTPMRVCTGTGTAAVTDPEGNVCNWVACGYETTTPNQYFGGCAGNNTAGTLCCGG